MAKNLKKVKDRFSGFWYDFKKFINKGNVLDLAIAVVIGGVFGAIITSLVNDIISPLISLLTGQTNFADLKWVIRKGTQNAAEVAIRYGTFLQTLINFLLVALTIFIIYKIVNRFRKLTRKKQQIKLPLTKTEMLLESILTELQTINKTTAKDLEDTSIKDKN